MGFIDTLGKIERAYSIAKPIVESLSTKLQPEMKQFAECLFTIAEKYPSMERFAKVIDQGADLLNEVLVKQGIEADSAEMLGYKVAQAAKSPRDFKTVDAYLDYLKNDVQVDTEKFRCMSSSEKTFYTIIGVAIEASALSENFGIKVNADFVMLLSTVLDIGKIALDAKKVIDMINLIKSVSVLNLEEICNYFKGEGDFDRIAAGKIIKDIFEGIFPGQGNETIDEIKTEMRD